MTLEALHLAAAPIPILLLHAPGAFAEVPPGPRSVVSEVSYECGRIPRGRALIVVVPPEAIVERVASAAPSLEVCAKKALHFVGSPPLPRDRSLTNSGVAWQNHGTELLVATFGEWDSLEGGIRIGLRVVVPSEVEVRTDAHLRNAYSLAQAPPYGPLHDWTAMNASPAWDMAVLREVPWRYPVPISALQQQCFEAERAARPESHGAIRVEVAFSATGEVIWVRTAFDEVGSVSLSRCLEATFETLRFPATGSSGTAEVPFILRTTQSAAPSRIPEVEP